MSRRFSLLKTVLAVVAAALLIVLLRRLVPADDFRGLAELLGAGEAGQGRNLPYTAAVFILLYAAGTVAVMPSFILTVTGGFIFGAWAGTFVNLAGATLGASGCFLLSRRFGGKAAPEWAARNKRLLAVERTLSARGARGVMVLRLTPMVPFSALNYGFGLTRVRFADFVAGTFIGLLPKVWLGTLIGAGAERFL